MAIKSAAALLARTRTWAAMSSVLNGLGALPGTEQDGRVRLPGGVTTILDRSVGPELYERDDALRDQILLHYRISLARMVDIARSAGAEVIFVTPASNPRDWTPFKSQHTDGLGRVEQARSEELLSTALDLIRDSAWSEAIDYRPPAPEAIEITQPGFAPLRLAPAQGLRY
jgi:hypothetical protein